MTAILRLAVSPLVRRELADRFPREEIDSIVAKTFDGYRQQQPSLPREAAIGGRIMVRLAALTIGLYRALVAEGVSDPEARSLTARVTWRAYSWMAAIPGVLSRVGSASSAARVRRATDLFRQFPFSAPSYQMVDVPQPQAAAAFDVKRCPAALYFRSQGSESLCIESWCNLDFRLAEQWGARLERAQTIAGGADHCDFRWYCSSAGNQSEPIRGHLNG